MGDWNNAKKSVADAFMDGYHSWRGGASDSPNAAFSREHQQQHREAGLAELENIQNGYLRVPTRGVDVVALVAGSLSSLPINFLDMVGMPFDGGTDGISCFHPFQKVTQHEQGKKILGIF